MSASTKMWIQVAGAVFFAVMAVAQGTGLVRPTFDSPLWVLMLVFACFAMLFEAWRTWRKANAENGPPAMAGEKDTAKE